MPRVRARRIVVGQPSGVADPGCLQFGECMVWIANAVHGCRELERTNRLDQIRPELRGSLLVAPVANPHQIVLAAVRRERCEDASVSGLVPGEGSTCPTE